MRRFFQFALLVVVLAMVALVSAVITMHFAIHGAEVKVPDFRAMTESDAKHLAADDGLEMSVDDHFYSAVLPPGRVLTQSPAPGTIVRRGWHVRISQSLGAQRVGVPSVLEQPEREATLTLRRAGLQLGTVARMPEANAAPATVIAQSPSPGAAAVERPSVALLLSAPLPPEATAYVMPDLVNGPAKPAADAIAEAGLKLAPFLYRQAPIPSVGTIAEPGEAPAPPRLPVVPGTVVAQSPAAGQRVEAGATIQLTLAQ
jgi:eukaryotic-like serine/threonine-protein kinase